MIIDSILLRMNLPVCVLVPKRRKPEQPKCLWHCIVSYSQSDCIVIISCRPHFDFEIGLTVNEQTILLPIVLFGSTVAS